MSYTQTGRLLSVTTPLGKDFFLLAGFTGHESISRLFQFQLQCVATNDKKPSFDALLGQPVTVELTLPDKSKKYINGICNRVAQGVRDLTFTRYLIDIVPKFWLLTRKTQSKTYQHISVPDILKRVLADGKVDFSWEVKGTFEPRDFCVQYRESEYAFASRLMEEEGIYYFFKHSAGSHTMVVANDPGSHSDLSPKSSLIFEAVLGGTRAEDRITSWEKSQELKSGKVKLWDHCFELPYKNLEAETPIQAVVSAGKSSHKLKVGGNDKFELYDWPGAYAQRFDGINKSGGEQPAELQKIFQDNARTTGIRMQAEAAASVLVSGSSNVRHLTSGFKFTLERHFEGDGPWVLYQIEHVASEAADARSGRGGFSYQNHFSCFPAGLPFRPPRVTPRPVVEGTQTALVVGPPGEEIFTDKFGRIKVQFHWDREGKNDIDSSCWVRVGQPVAGRRWGASFWPRIGQEVIVDFLEGDPDQPIVIGSVYNADQMPPYLGQGPDPKHKNDNKVMGVKSNTTTGGVGYNEWRFDDTKDKEQIFVHAERNMDTRVKNDSMESVGANKHLTVGGEKDGKKWGDYKEHVYQDVHLHNDRNLQQHVGGDMTLLVGGEDGPGKLDLVVKDDRKTLVEKNDNLHVKFDRKEKVDGSIGQTVGGSLDAKLKNNMAVEAGISISLKASSNLILDAGSTLSITGGGSSIILTAAGIWITGAMVYINSGSGPPALPVACSPSAADDAAEAAPGDPTPADSAKSGLKSC